MFKHASARNILTQYLGKEYEMDRDCNKTFEEACKEVQDIINGT